MSIQRVLDAPVAVAGDFAGYVAVAGLVFGRSVAPDRNSNRLELAANTPSS